MARVTRSTRLLMDSTPQQMNTITDHFTNVVRSARKNALSAKKATARSLSDDFDKMTILGATTTESVRPAKVITDSTPSKRFAGGKVDSVESAGKRAKTVAVTRSTRAMTIKATSSRKRIDFGPRLDRLELEELSGSHSPAKKARVAKSSENGASKAAEMKEKLKGCKDLTKLKEQLAAADAKLKQFKASNVRSPLKPCNSRSVSRKLFGVDDETASKSAEVSDSNNNDSSASAVPVRAYLKYKNLTKQANSEDELKLPLPVHYSDLLDQFKTIDEVTAIHQKRQQTLTWNKLKQSIELSTKRTFTLDAFVKMLTVLEKDSKKWFKFAYDVIDRKLQLTIAPFYPDHIRCINSAQILLERQKEFHLALLELTKQDHLQYLAKNGIVVEAQQLFAWHPMYPLDGAPEIIPNMALLPPKPKLEVQRSITSFFARREPVKETVEAATTAEASPPPTGRVESGKLKGVKMDLLKKIREKEAAKKAKFNFCPPAIDLELSSLSAMPQVIRIVNQYFQNTPGRSHTVEALIGSIASSTKWSDSLSEKRLNHLLAFDEKQSLVSGGCHKQWMRKVRSAEDGTVYLMIDPDYKQVHSLQQLIQLRINQLRESIGDKSAK